MIGKGLRFVSKLPSYTVKHTVIRIVLVGFTAFLFLFIAANITQRKDVEVTIVNYIQVMLFFIVGSEINVLLDNITEHFFPIPEKIGIRIFLHLFISVAFAWAAVVYFQNLLGSENLLQEPIVRLMMVLAGIFVFILLISSMGLHITEKWINSVNELEKLKQAKLQSDYNTLQDQLNPHFLFNNLSILKSMIIYDQKAAVKFTENFTDVYRYILQSHGKTTIKLKEEISFIRSYIEIHKERLGESLAVEIDIEENMLENNLPSLSLQLLVENAIKHNIAAKNKPLQIKIFTADKYIIVQNNVQRKESSYSTHSGLKNLVQRYKIITEKEVIIQQTDTDFTVKLPIP